MSGIGRWLVLGLLLWTGCKKAASDSQAPPPASSTPIPPPMLDPSHGKKLRTFAPPTFPKTLCGSLVQRIYTCELEKVEQNSALQEGIKRSILAHKKEKFATKMPAYLAHCGGAVKGLSPEAVRACLAKPCPAMDNCLQKLARERKKGVPKRGQNN